MRSLLIGISCLFVAGAACTSIAAGPAPHATALEAVFDEAVESDAFSGVALVARDGVTLFHRAAGQASIEGGVLNTTSTKFKIFSTTKQFTAAAILLLAQDGLITIDDQLGKYFPNAPATWRTATIHELLTHTSGIPDHVNLLLEHYDETDLKTIAAVFDKLGDDAARNDASDAFAYSNFGYQLLLGVIERASGMSFAEFLRRRVFEPCGMATASVETPADPGDASAGAVPIDGLAQGYNGSADEPAPTTSLMFVNLGAGGVSATSADLMQYDAMLRSGDLLTMHTQQLAIDRAVAIREGVSVGYGWFIRTDDDGVTTLDHSGGVNGFTSQYIRLPAEDLCVIVLSNQGFARSGSLARSLLSAARQSDGE